MLQEKNSILFIPVILFLILPAMPAELQAQQQRTYERGLEEYFNGNRTQALDVWFNAYQREGGVDTRIGLEYIRVVTENRMKDYYGQATELYYRAILDASGDVSRVAIRQEINRLRPIIGEGIYRQWVSWWENENDRLGSDMRGFWVQEDPTPARTANERLIEHWQRIAEAKVRFNKNSNTVYGTDDRAFFYIRYGNPDRTRTGILTLQNLNIRSWLQNQMNPYTDRSSGEEQPYDRELSAADQREMFERLQDAIYEFHRYPEYEIWFYDDLIPGKSEPVVFIFGTDVNSGEFRYRRSVEDFIPERAYNSTMELQENGIEFTRSGFSPALMLQLLYYEQLVQADPFFNNRLNEIREKVLEQHQGAYRGLDLAVRTESRELIQQRASGAPREQSTFLERMPNIPFRVYQYRFLDDNGKPFLLTYLESRPQEAFLIDYHRGRIEGGRDNELLQGHNVLEQFSQYELVHTLIEYDDSWRIGSNNEHKPDLILDRSSSTETPSRSLFRMEHASRSHRSASVKLMNFDPESENLFDTPFSPELRGLNRVQYRVPQPLVSHADSLEMADLVLGYESESESTEPFTFLVANDGIIPYEKTLVLHFEVYNLKRMDDGIGFTRFELTYRILPVEEDGTVRTDESEFVLTLNFTNEDRNVIEDLEIETANLNPGLYDLRVQIIDTETGQQKERRTRFEVIE